MKDRWTVVKETFCDKRCIHTTRRYLFGKNIDEYYTEDDCKPLNVEIIPYELWTAEDFVEILSNEYEDANFHRFTSVPAIILKVINTFNFNAQKRDYIVKLICEALYKEI